MFLLLFIEIYSLLISIGILYIKKKSITYTKFRHRENPLNF